MLNDPALVNYLGTVAGGTVLTILVGLFIRRVGQAMLVQVYSGDRAAGMTRMVTVGFYLVALGLLALISTVTVPVNGLVQMLVTKFGVVLLILGVLYGLTLLVLGRIRDDHLREELDADYYAAMRARSQGRFRRARDGRIRSELDEDYRAMRVRGRAR